MDEPNSSGFRFPESDQLDPVVSGGSLTRHFRLETDASGWWLVPGPSAEVFPEGVFTTELKCGVAADAQCQDWTTAPLSELFQGAIRLTLEMVLEEELKAMVGARRFERVGSRKDHRNGTYLRRLLTSWGRSRSPCPGAGTTVRRPT